MTAIPTLSRGWVLIFSNTPGDSANKILTLRDPWVLSSKDYYVVRADVVQVIEQGVSFNIVVPVFAKNPEGLDMAVAEIRELRDFEIKTITLARVTEHHPERPHETWGYIPSSETNPKPDAGPLAWNGWG